MLDMVWLHRVYNGMSTWRSPGPRVRMSEGEDRNLELAFWWRIQELPSPMRLLNWAREWEEQFVRKLSDFSLDRLERIAYAWILPASVAKSRASGIDERYT